MRFTYLFFSLLLCLSSYAQPNPINRRAMAIAGLASGGDLLNHLPDLKDGIWIRLKSSDLVMSNGVSSWVDEIQHYQFNQGDNTKLPTNTVNGVQFDGSTEYLTNVALTFPGSSEAGSALLLIVKLNTAGLGFGGVVMHNSYAAVNTDGYYFGGAGNDVWTQGASAIGTVLTDALGNTKHGDLFTADGVAPNNTFTNGIATTKVNAFGHNFILDIIGDGSSHNAKYKGTIQELVIWTNTSGWSTITASNAHYYATNTYSGISP